MSICHILLLMYCKQCNYKIMYYSNYYHEQRFDQISIVDFPAYAMVHRSPLEVALPMYLGDGLVDKSEARRMMVQWGKYGRRRRVFHSVKATDSPTTPPTMTMPKPTPTRATVE